MRQFLLEARKMASRCVSPLALRAVKAYVAGERLDDALAVGDRLKRRGLGVTVAYWDAPDDSPRRIANEYLAGIRALADREGDYLSIKLPSLNFSRELVGELVEEATRCDVRLHGDALAPEAALPSRALLEESLGSGAELSYTLPGRWRRSIIDAAWAVENDLTVRVVKGQWPETATEPAGDLRAGFLRVIDALAGRARHVAVASHDVPLVDEAIRRLRAAGTSCELELLYGLPMRRSLEQAQRLALEVHVYVPYGKSYLPYALSRLGRNPRIMWWLMRDLFAGRSLSGSPAPNAVDN